MREREDQYAHIKFPDIQQQIHELVLAKLPAMEDNIASCIVLQTMVLELCRLGGKSRTISQELLALTGALLNPGTPDAFAGYLVHTGETLEHKPLALVIHRGMDVIKDAAKAKKNLSAEQIGAFAILERALNAKNYKGTSVMQLSGFLCYLHDPSLVKSIPLSKSRKQPALKVETELLFSTEQKVIYEDISTRLLSLRKTGPETVDLVQKILSEITTALGSKQPALADKLYIINLVLLQSQRPSWFSDDLGYLGKYSPSTHRGNSTYYIAKVMAEGEETIDQILKIGELPDSQRAALDILKNMLATRTKGTSCPIQKFEFLCHLQNREVEKNEPGTFVASLTTEPWEQSQRRR